MNQNITVSKTRFDAVLKRLISSPPTSMAEAVAKPKYRKDGDLRKARRLPALHVEDSPHPPSGKE